MRPGVRLARTVYEAILDRVEALDHDVLAHPIRVAPWRVGKAALSAFRRPVSVHRPTMTVRATARGAQRHSLDGTIADVLICGASFGGLAVARELARSGAAVLIVDRYEIGERATSACAAPTPWLHALGLGAAIRQELPHMRFTTPTGSVRYRLPWSWAAFDYRQLCQLLYAQSDARFETAMVRGRRRRRAPRRRRDNLIAIDTDRGVLRAPLVVDALGWRRVLGRAADTSLPTRRCRAAWRSIPRAAGVDLDVWIERSLVRRGYGWRVPADGEARVGVASYAPAEHVRQPTVELADRLGVDAVRYQGNWFPHRLRPAAEDSVFFVGDSAGHCFPLSGEGIRTALYFGIACGRELRAAHAGRRIARRGPAALRRVQRRSRPSVCDRRPPAAAGAGDPAPLLSIGLRLIGRQRLIDRSFGWYLDQAHPSFATRSGGRPAPDQ